MASQSPIFGTDCAQPPAIAYPMWVLRDKLALQNTLIPAQEQAVYLEMYQFSAPQNGGGAIWIKRPTPPTGPIYNYYAQSLDGAWWEVSRVHGQTVTPAMYGYPGLNVTVTPSDPWGTICEDIRWGGTVRFTAGCMDVAGWNTGGFTWPVEINLRGKACNLTGLQSGSGKWEVDVNANFVVDNGGRIRAQGLHFPLYAGVGPQEGVWTLGNCTLSLVNCTAKNWGAPGEYVSATRDGNCKIDIDPTNNTRECLIDWRACTNPDCIIGEGGIDLMVRAGKISDGAGGYLANRNRMVILCPHNTRGGIYVLRGRTYIRSPVLIGDGTGQGITVTRSAMGYLHPYPVGTPTPGLTFRDPGYVYPDELRCGCINFEKGVAVRSDAIVSVTSDDSDDDNSVSGPNGVWVMTGHIGVYTSAGRFDAASGSLDLSGCTVPARRDSTRVTFTDNSLNAYETTTSDLPLATAGNRGAVIQVSDAPGSGFLVKSDGANWQPFNVSGLAHIDIAASTLLAAQHMRRVIRGDATAGAINLDLPQNASEGDWVELRKSDVSANRVTVRNFNGAQQLAFLSTQADMVRFAYWGTSWFADTWRISPYTEVFTSSTNWTKPPLLQRAEFRLCAGGNGGGSGAREPAATAATGGAGGNGGHWLKEMITVDRISNGNRSITIGAGGPGGASVTSDGTAGNNGGIGGTTQINLGGFTITAANSVAAGGGSTAAATVGPPTAARSTWGQPGQGGNSSATAAGVSGNTGSCGGGGGAGGVTAANAATDGAQGGSGSAPSSSSPANGTAGTGGGAGGAGGDATSANLQGGSGGGGGGGATAAAAGAGGAGGLPGGGGGGGAGSRNGFASGKGGDGGRGECRITSYFQ